MHSHGGPGLPALAAIIFPRIPRPHRALTRDAVMFTLGATAFAYETITGGDRPNVIYAALTLMAGAAYLRGMASADRGPK